ncbi:hypothetical protein GWI33_015526 [Rhynchophorus ferrugineus]|uniref:Uncharacterized protein n=1 Tax=Rhynchophorus ferrugineus TaxID=354439 RepID=A0A834M817_RHYFE|nr:hypothetical protein GWI33_015526 [Rhynchophorus ferrugineus]
MEWTYWYTEYLPKQTASNRPLKNPIDETGGLSVGKEARETKKRRKENSLQCVSTKISPPANEGGKRRVWEGGVRLVSTTLARESVGRGSAASERRR